MSTQVPNPTVRNEMAVPQRASSFLHPDYVYYAPEWEKIRDAEIGEVEVKRKREKYLPKMPMHDAKQYAAYLQRAVFYNMTSRTLNALYGTVFKRLPKISGLPKRFKPNISNITKDGMSLHLLAKTMVKEVLAVGRFGMLVDANPDGTGDAYIAHYVAENIVDWEMAEINGRWKLAKVTLREIYYDRKGLWAPYEYKVRYRMLLLNDYDGVVVYEQFLYEDLDSFSVPDLDNIPNQIITPTVRGQTLDYIPFLIVGPFTNHPDVQKPPILDIVTLNYAHYYSYAQLEHGRFYTACPTYWVQNDANAQAEYSVGPDTVWILDKGEQAGILEFNGVGLKFLESALAQKESQISAIGGRMMPGTSRGASESDNSLLMQEKNEQTLLLNLADTSDDGLTQTLRWWADWNNASQTEIDEILFEVSRDFLIKDAGAREFRAIHQMYADGVIPLEVVYDYLKRADVIPEWMDKAEYEQLLRDSKQFPNMVDVLAKMQMFPDAKSFHEYRLTQEGLGTSGEDVEGNPDDPDMPGVPSQARAAREMNRSESG